MATGTATDFHGRTAAERQAERDRREKLAAAQAVARARELSMSMRCWMATAWEAADPGQARAMHQMCQGESPPKGAGCLCRCHDPLAGVIADAAQS